MDVTCQRCGAGVPAENAFCAECGAVMFEGAQRERRDDPSAQLSATISGAYSLRDLPVAEPPPATAANADARGPATSARTDAAPAPVSGARPNLSHAPEAARSRSMLFLVVGVAAMLALGGLLIYLIRLILRG